MKRQLAAILAVDVVGYFRQMGRTKPPPLRLHAIRAEFIGPLLRSTGGQLLKTTGDGFLAEFSSTVRA